MEYAVTDEESVPVEITELKDSESTEKFQKFIHELFENNGILNDLRAYLRGHIINVLKSAEIGVPIPSQKKFTQHLELTFQAMNILIVEYFLRMDFNYSLSVFSSEIPLSNMVFKFAKVFLNKKDSVISGLRFGESDIWSILSYLGIKCDSEHASKIVKLYKSDLNTPLLLCILKCTPMYHRPIGREQVCASDESVSISAKSEDIIKNEAKYNKCKHCMVCEVCQNRLTRLKEKYKRNKMKMDENPKSPHVKALNVENCMNIVDTLEQSLVDEMFQQVKTVYEREVDMIRDEKEKKIKRSIANHASQLQIYREELEELFSARHRELQERVWCRQRFLCSLAKRLAAAQKQLAEEESNLKTKMQEAERTLKKKGEEMKTQISEELNLLQSNLEEIKRERDTIDRERLELENIKQMYNESLLKEKVINENEDLKHNYDILKEEIVALRKHIEASKLTKCLIERGTETDICGVKSTMNNENVGSCKSDDRFKVTQVVNDLKKRKNVNFSQTNLEDVDRETKQSSSDVMNTENIAIQQLKEENERLMIFAKQQSEHIERLSAERQRLQDEMHKSRPTTAPSAMCNNNYLPHSTVNPYPDELGVQPRVLFPVDTIPFIGVIGNRQNDDSRRRLLTQWRRQRSCDGTSNQPHTSAINTHNSDVTNNRRTNEKSAPSVCDTSPALKPVSPVRSETRERSPQTVLRKVKEKLRNNNKKEPSPIRREKSPNATLREAKLRLRKLEIEAEAVEKSYQNYRRRQMELKRERDELVPDDDVMIKSGRNLGKKSLKFIEKLEKPFQDSSKFSYKESPDIIKKDFDKYFLEYQNVNLEKTSFQNMKSVIGRVKPSTESYTSVHKNENKSIINYLETPLIEFRKLYQTGKSKTKLREEKHRKINSNHNIDIEDDISKQNSFNAVESIQSDAENESIMQENENYNCDNLKTDIKSDISTKAMENIQNDINIESNIQENERDFNNIKKDITSVTEIDIPKTNTEKIALEENIANKNSILEVNDLENNLEILDMPKKNEILTNNINNQESEKEENNEVIEQTIDLIENVDQKSNRDIENEENLDNNKNLLMVEVDNVFPTTNIGVTESSQDLLVIVESSIDTKENVPSDVENDPEISTQMTVIVTPKQDLKDIGDKLNNLSPEITKLSENDALNDIYHSDINKISSIDMNLDLNKLEMNSDVDKIQEYQDDFSADVDNYNSPSEYGNNSPISLPKTSDDENFWES